MSMRIYFYSALCLDSIIHIITLYFIKRQDFRAALARKMPLYPVDAYANEYDEDEFILQSARENGYA